MYLLLNRYPEAGHANAHRQSYEILSEVYQLCQVAYRLWYMGAHCGETPNLDILPSCSVCRNEDILH